MKLNRFYCSPIINGIVTLDPVESRHLASVIRLSKGDRVHLFDGVGTQATATVLQGNPRQSTLEVSEIRPIKARKHGRIVLAVSVAKAQRFDWLIAKCTELGVDEIIPTIYHRTVKYPKGATILDRYRKIAIAAAKQCERVLLPKIGLPKELSDVLDQLQREYQKSAIIVGSLDENAKPLANRPFDNRDTVAFVGPEGGMTEQEEAQLKKADAQQVRLTDTILRVETAGVAISAILAAQRHCLDQLPPQ